MSFERPSLPEIVERIEADLTASLELSGKPLRRSIIKAFARAKAGAAHSLHGHLSYIAEQVMPDTAVKSALRRWASIWGLEATEASFAEGGVTMTGSNGSVIPTGTLWRRSDGAEYESLADATITAGTATPTVRALVAGEDGNADTGVTLTLVSPISGVNSQGTVASPGIDGGSDEEDDDSLRARLLERLRQPPLGGADHDYVQWAKEVAGVTRVWVYPLWLGEGTVGVTFTRDNDDDIIPSSQEVEDVADYIEEVRPVTAHVTVFAPTGVEVDFEITLDPDDEETKAAVEAELTDMIFRDAKPGGTILYSRMHEAISIAAGESDHVLISPTGNFVASTGFLPIMGTITWA